MVSEFGELMTQAGEDGSVDHRGEALPTLTKASSKVRLDALMSVPQPRWDRAIPGSPLWTKTAFVLLRIVARGQFKTMTHEGLEGLDHDRGAMCCAWHVNALMDPLTIMLTHPSHFVIGGRHDLVTRPILSFWTRRMAVQPVVRKAELLRGGFSKEEAQNLNGRTLLNLARGISHGHGSALFPEGTAHDEAHPIRMRTGPMRTVLAAAAIAHVEGRPLPHLVPVGLHFRVRHHFRTDAHVEYGTPIPVALDAIPEDLLDAVKRNDWSEPPAEAVTALRDALTPTLRRLTPDVVDWDERRALHTLAHVRARSEKRALPDWRSEVMAARAERDALRPEGDRDLEAIVPEPLVSPALDAADAVARRLEAHGLDGRDLNEQASGLRRNSPSSFAGGVIRMAQFLPLLPVFLLSMGIQSTLGFVKGNSTDEGVDARTTYHFVFALFASMIVWPIVSGGLAATSYALGWLDATGMPELAAGLMFVLLFPVFVLSGWSFASAWDGWVVLRGGLRRSRLRRRHGAVLAEELQAIHVALAD
jgi:hypothetical protein